MEYDLAITNGLIVTCNDDFEIIEFGRILVKDGNIAVIDSNTSNIKTAKEIDAKGCIVMPGLINAHTHLPMSMFRGLADDLPLMEWLNEHIFPAESKFIDPAFVQIGTRLSIAETLLSGTTTICDGYFLEEYIAQAVNETGIRAVLAQGVIDFPAPGVPDPAKNIEHALDYIHKIQNKYPLITPSIFCHSPASCSEKAFINAKEAASSLGLILQTHFSETKSEFMQIKEETGKRPAEYLDSIGVLDEKTLLVHSVWLEDKEISIVKESGCSIVHNPESNMKLGSGIAPVPKYLNAGITTALGTDGCASNNDLDMFCEMDSAAKIHKAATLDPSVTTAEAILKMATIDGARAIGLGDVTGSLQVGKAADIVVVDIRKPHLVPMYNPVSHIVYSVKGSDVKHVVINGQHAVDNGKCLTVDVESAIDDALTMGEKIMESKN